MVSFYDTGVATLYLTETHAQRTYACAGCRKPINRGSLHFRHDPHPMARFHRGESTSHWCQACITSPGGPPGDHEISRILYQTYQQPRQHRPNLSQRSLFDELPSPVEMSSVELISGGALLEQRLAFEPTLIHQLTPEEFEEFICDRLTAMNLEPKRVGHTNRRDGGIDILFWPRAKDSFPFLGAAQVKHHRDPRVREGPDTVRSFGGVMAAHPLNVGLIVTNTAFTPDAQWFAREHAKLIRLRGYSDLLRWIGNNFASEEEIRDLPTELEVCPGVKIPINWPHAG